MTNRRKTGLWIAGALLCGAGVASGIVMYNQNTEKVTPTSVPTEVVTQTPTPTEEVSVSVAPTPEPTEEPTPTVTEEVTPTVTEEPTPTDEVTPTEVPTEMPTPTPEPTAIPTVTPSPVPTVTNTPTPTKAAPTNTPTPTQKPATPTPTNTPIPTPTKAAEQATKVWVATTTAVIYKPESNDYMLTKVGPIDKGVEITRVITDVTNQKNEGTWLDEIVYNGTHYWMWHKDLSETKVQGKYAEPMERKDIETLLMNKVNAYRESKGLRKFENPNVYYDVTNPGQPDRMYANGLRVAKRCCLEQSANHEGSQIGAGWYSTGCPNPRGAEEVANELFNNWINSPGHNANILTVFNKDYYIDMAVMVVVEYYDGDNYQYCAIMTYSAAMIANLPSGLQ